MGSPLFLGNFASPAPLQKKAMGPPRQIAYYSCFSGPTNEYEYQSRMALKFYSPPTVPFSFLKAPDKSSWAKECNYLDSLPPQGIEPVITSCQRAGCTLDLIGANIIARRGAIVKYPPLPVFRFRTDPLRLSLALGKQDVYDISFVEGKLCIFRKSFDIRTEIKHKFVHQITHLSHRCSRPLSGPYYGYCSLSLSPRF